jgi:hypothetical protein
MKKVKLFEEYIQEATTSWSKMMKGVRAGEGGPWSIVAIQDRKVVGQSNDIKIRDLIPAKYEALKKEFPRAKFHIEDGGGQVVWNESLNEALAATDKSKLTNKVEITVAIARTLMNNARTGKLKHMSAPGGVTHYWNPKTKEYIGRTEQEGRLNKGTFFFSDELDADGNLTESYVNEEFNISTIKAKDTIELTNTRTGDVGKYTVKRIFGGSSDIKEIEVLTRNKQLLTLYYSKERGLQNFKGDVYESFVTEAVDATRDELMDLMETKYGIKSVRPSEDFDGQTEGIWIAADNEEMMSGNKIFDYYNKSAKYKNGVLKTVVDAVEKRGWWFSWNDPGTMMCWPKN